MQIIWMGDLKHEAPMGELKHGCRLSDRPNHVQLTASTVGKNCLSRLSMVSGCGVFVGIVALFPSPSQNHALPGTYSSIIIHHHAIQEAHLWTPGLPHWDPKSEKLPSSAASHPFLQRKLLQGRLWKAGLVSASTQVSMNPSFSFKCRPITMNTSSQLLKS